jgi:hypothetical protein
MFVTNANLSSDAQTYANHNRIMLLEGEKLKDEFYLMKLGRLDSPPEMVLESALPISVSYTQATRIDLVNTMKLHSTYKVYCLRPLVI